MTEFRSSKRASIRSASNHRLIPYKWFETEHDPSWSYHGNGKGSSLHHIHFVVSGFATWTGSQREAIELKPGAICLAPANSVIQRHCPKSMKSYIMILSYELIPGLDLLHDVSQPLEIGHWDSDRYGESWSPRNLSLEQAWTIVAMTESAILQSCLKEVQSSLYQQDRVRKPFLNLLSDLEEKVHAGIRVEEMAAQLNMNRSSFTRAFQRELGRSPKDHLNVLLHKRACRLLSDSHRLVKDISDELGFSNEYYFNRFFRRHQGDSPGRFRKTLDTE